MATTSAPYNFSVALQKLLAAKSHHYTLAALETLVAINVSDEQLEAITNALEAIAADAKS